MSEPKQPYKISVESANGTQTDITSFVSSVSFDKAEQSTAEVITPFLPCDICGKPSAGAVAEFDDKGSVKVKKYYCSGHEPYFETAFT